MDIDLDSHEAIEAAKHLLPNTDLVWGRLSKPESHLIFKCAGIKTTQFTDVKDSAGKTSMLVEIRSNGGYTMMPPSTHPSNESIKYARERDPREIEEHVLHACVREVALAALLARHWPGSGARHTLAGLLAGFLLHAGLDGPAVTRIIKTAAIIAKDSDVADRLTFVASTCAAHANGQPVTGGPTLADTVGEDVVSKMRGWLKCKDTDAIEAMNAKHFGVRLGKDDCIGLAGQAGGKVACPEAVISLPPDSVNNLNVIGEEIMHLHRCTRGYPTIVPGLRSVLLGYRSGLQALNGFFDEHAFFPFLEGLGLDPRAQITARMGPTAAALEAQIDEIQREGFTETWRVNLAAA